MHVMKMTQEMTTQWATQVILATFDLSYLETDELRLASANRNAAEFAEEPARRKVDGREARLLAWVKRNTSWETIGRGSHGSSRRGRVKPEVAFRALRSR